MPNRSLTGASDLVAATTQLSESASGRACRTHELGRLEPCETVFPAWRRAVMRQLGARLSHISMSAAGLLSLTRSHHLHDWHINSTRLAKQPPEPHSKHESGLYY